MGCSHEGAGAEATGRLRAAGLVVLLPHPAPPERSHPLPTPSELAKAPTAAQRLSTISTSPAAHRFAPSLSDAASWRAGGQAGSPAFSSGPLTDKSARAVTRVNETIGSECAMCLEFRVFIVHRTSSFLGKGTNCGSIEFYLFRIQ